MGTFRAFSYSIERKLPSLLRLRSSSLRELKPRDGVIPPPTTPEASFRRSSTVVHGLNRHSSYISTSPELHHHRDGSLSRHPILQEQEPTTMLTLPFWHESSIHQVLAEAESSSSPTSCGMLTSVSMRPSISIPNIMVSPRSGSPIVSPILSPALEAIPMKCTTSAERHVLEVALPGKDDSDYRVSAYVRNRYGFRLVADSDRQEHGHHEWLIDFPLDVDMESLKVSLGSCILTVTADRKL